jgi:hypothetical protein
MFTLCAIVSCIIQHSPSNHKLLLSNDAFFALCRPDPTETRLYLPATTHKYRQVDRKPVAMKGESGEHDEERSPPRADAAEARAIASTGPELPDLASLSNVRSAPIMAASGDVEGLCKLVRSGTVSHDEQFEGLSLPHHAAMYGQTAVLEALKECGFPLGQKNDEGRTPAHMAAESGHAKALATLKEFGSCLDVMDRRGYTPAHQAALNGHVDVLRVLATSGISLQGRAKNGLMPSHHAAMNNHASVLTMLSEMGCDLNAKTCDGQAPAHFAALYGHIETLRCLADLGVSIDVQNNQGRAPYKVAIERGHHDASRELKNLWRRMNTKTHEDESDKDKDDVGSCTMCLERESSWVFQSCGLLASTCQAHIERHQISFLADDDVSC